MNGFSPARLFAMLIEESLQMRRDRATVGLTVALPLIQLFLFGYAINANPRHLPTGLLAAEHSTYERTLAAALQNTGYSTSGRWRARVKRSRPWRAATSCSC